MLCSTGSRQYGANVVLNVMARGTAHVAVWLLPEVARESVLGHLGASGVKGICVWHAESLVQCPLNQVLMMGNVNFWLVALIF